MKIYEHKKAFREIRKFLAESDERRYISTPQLNLDAWGLCSEETRWLCQNLFESNLVDGSGRIKIVANLLKSPDWGSIVDALDPEFGMNIEIRHSEDVGTPLFILPDRFRAYMRVNLGRAERCCYDDDETVLLDSGENSPAAKKVTSIFNYLWSCSEPVTWNKAREVDRLLWQPSRFSFKDEADLEDAYILLVPSKGHQVLLNTAQSPFCSLAKEENKECELSYLFNIEIPRKAEWLVVCLVDEDARAVTFWKIFSVKGSRPIRYDVRIRDLLNRGLDVEGFSIVSRNTSDKAPDSWYKSVIDMFTSTSPCTRVNRSYIAAAIQNKETALQRKLAQTLTKKLVNGTLFKDAVQTQFIKWSEYEQFSK